MKRFRKGIAVLLCALMLFPMFSMTPVWAADLTETGSQVQNETEGQEETSENMVPSEMAEIQSVTLHAGSGTLEDSTTVTLSDGKLPELPVPSRTGWNFKGWYTGAVTENFYGNDPGETEADIKNRYSVEQLQASWDMLCASFQAAGYPVGDYADPEYKCLMFSWIIFSEGIQVNSGDELDAGVTELYAMYVPNPVKVEFYLNGWTNSRALALTTYTQYGAYFTALDLNTSSLYQWSGRTFDGWYDASEGGNKYDFNIQGADERINYCAQPLTGDLKLYAHWNGGTEAESLSFARDSYALEPGEDFTVTVGYSPMEANVPEVIWTSSDESLVWLKSISEDSRTATFETSKNTGTENQNVTVSAALKGNPAVTASVKLTLRHEWNNGRTTRWPSCEQGGTVEYTCRNCQTKMTRNIAADGHRYVTRTVLPACTSDGYEERYCIVCKKIESTTVIQAVGHSWITSSVSGCAGTVTTKTCTTCGVVEVSSDPGAAVHVWETVPTVDRYPTCHTEGSQSFHCRNCDLTRDSSVIPADPALHTWGEWETNKKAEKLEDGTVVNGEEQHTCTICGAVEIRMIIYSSLSDVQDSEIDMEIENNLTPCVSDSIADGDVANDALKNTLKKIVASYRTSTSAEEKTLAESIWSVVMENRTITVAVEHTVVDMGDTPENAEQFRALAGSAPLTFLDIDMVVMSDERILGYLTELDEAITLRYALPEGATGRIFQVLREHNGVIAVLDSWAEDDMVYFATDKFSVYAIGSTNDIAYATVAPIQDQTYSGSEITPDVQVTINGSEILEEGKDYIVSYLNNVEIGTATVIITGIGDFEGSMNATFAIKNKADEVPAPGGNTAAGGTTPEGNTAAGGTTPEGNTTAGGTTPEGNTTAGGTTPEGNTTSDDTVPGENTAAGGTDSDGNTTTGATKPDENTAAGATVPDGNIATDGTNSDENTTAGVTAGDGNTASGDTDLNYSAVNITNTKPFVSLKTGESSNATVWVVWLALMVLSGCALALVLMRKHMAVK